MIEDQYLRGVIQKYTTNVAATQLAGNIIYPLIQKWSNVYLINAKYSGSLVKGTSISLGTDADIFISLSSNTPDSLKGIYETLCAAAISSGYNIRRQNVSIGLTVNGTKLDLVPAKRQSQYGNDHSLYKYKTDTWTKTNIDTHISYVKNSKRVEEIKLAKIWRELHRLNFPSFYLEMTVIHALQYSRVGDIANNFRKVLEFIASNIQSNRYVDPANTNNNISDELDILDKNSIANQAYHSRNKTYWREVVW